MCQVTVHHHDKDWRNGDLEDKFELIDSRKFKTMKDAKLWILPEEQGLEFRDGSIVSALEEKKFKPKFKVDDVIQMINAPQFKSTIKKIKNEGYLCNNDFITFDQEHKWELVMPDIKCNGCELQDSEDEKIRKAIINEISLLEKESVIEQEKNVYQSWIAWLEKQKPITDENYEQGKEDVLWCIKQAKKNAKDENEMGTCWFAEKWLEKQGEQKSIDELTQQEVMDIAVAKCFEQGKQKPVFEMKTPEESLGIDSDTYNKIVDECIYGEQKSTDKIEPKFKIGDWIVLSTSDGEKVVQIDSIEYFKSGEPRYITSEGRWFGNGTKAHLWTVQNAKDCDVLYSPCCKLLWIYKDEKTCYVGSNLNYNFGSIVINKPVCIPTDVHPATKEQREQLEKAIADAGYTFDFEKKELKKIKQNPVWSEEDEEHIKRIIEHFEDRKKDLKTQWVAELHNKEIDWLKSFKDRYTWKPSDEQMKDLKMAIDSFTFETDYLQKLYEDLKKLREN